MVKGEGRAGTSPTGRGVRTDVVSPLSVCDPTLSTLDSRTGGRSLAQWVAHHSVSDTSFRAAFVPCVRPVATAVSAARFLTSVRKLNNSCWLEHGHPGTGNKDLEYEYWVSFFGVPPQRMTVLRCSVILRGGTSEKLHGRAGVRDVSLPEKPFPGAWLVFHGLLRQTEGRSM